MQITNVRHEIQGGMVKLSADIVTAARKKYHIWFSVEEKYSNLLQLNANPFVPVSFVVASKLGEDLEVPGQKIDPILKANCHRANELLTKWDIGFKKAAIKADVSESRSPGPFAGLFFSGGVDSFYSLLKQRVGEPDVTHLVYIRGYDLDLRDSVLFSVVVENLKTVARESNKELVVVNSNIKEVVYDYLPWIYAFGSCLGSAASFLGKGFNTVYIPSSCDEKHLLPWGSHPDLDPLWSTSRTNVLHDGIEAGRLAKVKYIVKAPGKELVYHNLRVCFINPKGKYNCGTCHKCLRTLVELRVAKADKKMDVFDSPLVFDNIKKIDLKNEIARSFFEEALDEVRVTKDDPEMEAALDKLLNSTNTYRPSLFTRLRYYVGDWDTKHNKERLGKFLRRNRII